MIDLNALAVELQDAKYDNTTDAEALSILTQSTPTLGRIQGDSKLDLLTLVVANGIDDRLESAALDGANSETKKNLATALKKALSSQLLMTELYRINLGNTAVKNTFDAAVAEGLLLAPEIAAIEALATWDAPSIWVGTTLKDVYVVRNNLIGSGNVATSYSDGDFFINTGVNRARIVVKLSNPAPVPVVATVTIRECIAGLDNFEDVNYSEKPVPYIMNIPAGQQVVSRTVSSSDLARFVKVAVTLDVNLDAEVIVEGA